LHVILNDYIVMEKRNLVLILLLIMLGASVKAQNINDDTLTVKRHGFWEDWSIGIGLNHNYLIGDLMSLTHKEDDLDLGFGLQVNKQLSPYLELGFEYLGNKVSGSDPYEYFIEDYRFNFETDFSMYSLVGKFYINRLQEHLERQPKTNVYVRGGISFIDFEYSLVGRVDSKLIPVHERQQDTYDTWAYSLGLGLERKLTERLYLDFGITASITNNDYLDGNPTAFVKENNGDDILFSTKIGLSYGFGKKRERGFKWHNSFRSGANTVETREFESEISSLGSRLSNLENDLKSLKQPVREWVDKDNDGVHDADDLEPNTKEGAMVNFQGITIKSDGQIVNHINGMATFHPVFFRLNSTVMEDKYIEQLISVVTYLRNHQNEKLKLVGYADTSGGESHNLELSRKRVLEVNRILVKDFGVDSSRLSVDWKGENDQISTDRSLNRRVDFFLQ